ncbi:MAG TPA: FAD-binding oxidoreductase [Kofleriaceae bacterium]|nr:FAD-binding oxidoreductase [Kofleriaceae bacterium]
MARTAVDADRLRRALVPIVGERRLSQRESDLASYGRDMWPRALIGIRSGQLPPDRPHVVVWPESEREVAAIVRVAREMAVPIVPYGGGSGVCGGAVPILGGITVDLKRMNELSSVDRDEMTCDVEAGMNGERFERELNRRGYTLGHFPSSIYCSTVGGWLACRAAGQMSTKYGKIEDRVAGLTVVTGRGDVIHTDGPVRAQRGPNWTQLVVGSEGTLGIITSARLRLSPTPELRVLRGFEVESVAHGVEAIRRVMQRGLRPAVVRLYDEIDTFISHAPLFGSKRTAGRGDEGPVTTDGLRLAPVPGPAQGALPHIPPREQGVPSDHGGGPGAIARLIGTLGGGDTARRLGARLKRDAIAAAMSRPRLLNSLAAPLAERVSRRGCRMIIGLEGSRIRTGVEARLVFDELERAGAVDQGEEPGREWFEHRYAVSYKMSPAFRAGLFVDTMEVAATWERLMDLYHAVKQAIAQHAVVMAHFSHAYSEGCSIYFTFTARAEPVAAAQRAYDSIWRDALAAASRAGGTISHHHGIGLLKGPAMAAEHREAMTLLRGLKASLDPDGILNPGKLGLPASLGAGRAADGDEAAAR